MQPRSAVARQAASRFFSLNTRASRWCEERFAWQSDKPFWTEFERRVATAATESVSGDVLVDLGGGRRCVWIGAVAPGAHVVTVDIDQDELDANTVVDDRRVGDVSQHLPLADDEANLIVSRALLEHVDGVPAAVDEMARVLTDGGRALHFVPARDSLFGIAARLGPFEALKRLVHIAIPSSRGQVEFPVHYDHCTAGGLERLFRQAGFRSVDVDVCYSQSGYFHPVFPVYLVVALYQGIVKRLGLRNLAAYVLVDARR